MKTLLTLCLIRKENKVLLGMKKKGRMGVGKFNGFGGHVEKGETIEEAAIREVKEEADIETQDLEKIGIVQFRFKSKSEIREVHIFTTDHFLGEPKETEEMKPEWFYLNEIPFEQMWSDDKLWFPLFISGKKFRGSFIFGDKEETLLEQELIEVKEI